MSWYLFMITQMVGRTENPDGRWADMRRADIGRIARETLERGLPESDCIEYKRSDT